VGQLANAPGARRCYAAPAQGIGRGEETWS
jgi:hypothetical protein